MGRPVEKRSDYTSDLAYIARLRQALLLDDERPKQFVDLARFLSGSLIMLLAAPDHAEQNVQVIIANFFSRYGNIE